MNVLLIADHDFVLDGNVFFLSHIMPNWVTHRAMCISEALHRTADSVDLVLLDFSRFDESSIERVQRIRNHFKDAMLIVVSGADDSDTIGAVITAGASGFLSKSMRPSEFIAAYKAIDKGDVCSLR